MILADLANSDVLFARQNSKRTICGEKTQTTNLHGLEARVILKLAKLTHSHLSPKAIKIGGSGCGTMAEHSSCNKGIDFARY